ncbi:enolase C-terminal domain-like protein [Haloarchaeobius sp. TZWSO28]|uniref:enolase C-terminal domain-like protein n=1 Tax=Haloarchaeobius sp. TZWSO28 TaxID=3446119 RepID=UPI003EBB7998
MLDVIATCGATIDLALRLPFHFGNATIRRVPHLLLALDVDVDGRRTQGVAAENLIAPLFVKDRDRSYEAGAAEMLETVATACRFALDQDPLGNAFALQQAVAAAQASHYAGTHTPPLEYGFGVSMVERAVIDAVCRQNDHTFADGLSSGEFGIRPGAIYDELAGVHPTVGLPNSPHRSLSLRHTVGFTDPLRRASLPAEDRVDDGLPHSLESYIEAQGLDHFKVKLNGDVTADVDRLTDVWEVISAVASPTVTLDANESYEDAESFRDAWRTIADVDALSEMVDRIAYVEQPLHRDEALTDATARVFDRWADRPPVIIDESDDRDDRLGEALAVGYAGTTHKNCKGVFRGVVNACLLEHRRRAGEGRYVMSAEDLMTVGPIGLLQDLAVVSALGFGHVERNGHHYIHGLADFPFEQQTAVTRTHGDLYRSQGAGVPTVDVTDGRIDVGSVVDAPFGYGFDLHITAAPFEQVRELELA